jgi:hypothetical protein
VVQRITSEEYRKWAADAAPGGKSKFGAKKVVVDGYTFASVIEAKRYGELKALERGRKIVQLEIHPEFEVKINGILVTTYKADFRYLLPFNPVYDGPGSQVMIVEDVKSEGTRRERDWKLKKKVVEAACGITITEVIK